MGNIKNSQNLSYMRWTVDYPDDLRAIREIYKKLGASGRTHAFGLERRAENREEIPRDKQVNEGYD